MWPRIACIALVAACGQAERQSAPRPALDTRLARELTARFGVPVTTRCGAFALRCHATLVDGSELWVELVPSSGEWSWHADGTDTAPIAAHIDGVLADLGIAQTASCGRRVTHARKLVCKLSGGGSAFVTIARDGQLALELALDPEAAAARATPSDDAALLRASRALEHGDDDQP